MEKTNGTFSSRFTMVSSRESGSLGVLEEEECQGPREFQVIWEAKAFNDEVRANYTPRQLLTETIPENGRARRLFLELVSTTWWTDVPAEQAAVG